MLRCSWFWLIGILVVSYFCLGVGASIGLAWLWREQILVERRSKGSEGYGVGGLRRSL